MKNKNIFIFGLGHLSRFILDPFKDFNIEGSYRNSSRVRDLESVKKYVIDLNELMNLDLSQIKRKDFDLIIFTIPPRENYVTLLNMAHDFFDDSIPWIVTSSTGVYGDGEINESSPKSGQRRNSKILIEIEDLLKSFKKRKISIIRPGGIVDSKRNPVNFFKNKSIQLKAKDQACFIHSEDIARFYKYIFEKNLIGDDFNLVSSTFYTKKDFYETLDQKFNCYDNQLSFSDSATVRKISCEKVQKSGFIYKYPDILKEFLG